MHGVSTVVIYILGSSVGALFRMTGFIEYTIDAILYQAKHLKTVRWWHSLSTNVPNGDCAESNIERNYTENNTMAMCRRGGVKKKPQLRWMRRRFEKTFGDANWPCRLSAGNFYPLFIVHSSLACVYITITMFVARDRTTARAVSGIRSECTYSGGMKWTMSLR